MGIDTDFLYDGDYDGEWVSNPTSSQVSELFDTALISSPYHEAAVCTDEGRQSPPYQKPGSSLSADPPRGWEAETKHAQSKNGTPPGSTSPNPKNRKHTNDLATNSIGRPRKKQLNVGAPLEADWTGLEPLTEQVDYMSQRLYEDGDLKGVLANIFEGALPDDIENKILVLALTLCYFGRDPGPLQFFDKHVRKMEIGRDQYRSRCQAFIAAELAKLSLGDLGYRVQNIFFREHGQNRVPNFTRISLKQPALSEPKGGPVRYIRITNETAKDFTRTRLRGSIPRVTLHSGNKEIRFQWYDDEVPIISRQASSHSRRGPEWGKYLRETVAPMFARSAIGTVGLRGALPDSVGAEELNSKHLYFGSDNEALEFRPSSAPVQTENSESQYKKYSHSKRGTTWTHQSKHGHNYTKVGVLQRSDLQSSTIINSAAQSGKVNSEGLDVETGILSPSRWTLQSPSQSKTDETTENLEVQLISPSSDEERESKDCIRGRRKIKVTPAALTKVQLRVLERKRMQPHDGYGGAPNEFGSQEINNRQQRDNLSPAHGGSTAISVPISLCKILEFVSDVIDTNVGFNIICGSESGRFSNERRLRRELANAIREWIWERPDYLPSYGTPEILLSKLVEGYCWFIGTWLATKATIEASATGPGLDDMTDIVRLKMGPVIWQMSSWKEYFRYQNKEQILELRDFTDQGSILTSSSTVCDIKVTWEVYLTIQEGLGHLSQREWTKLSERVRPIYQKLLHKNEIVSTPSGSESPPKEQGELPYIPSNEVFVLTENPPECSEDRAEDGHGRTLTSPDQDSKKETIVDGQPSLDAPTMRTEETSLSILPKSLAVDWAILWLKNWYLRKTEDHLQDGMERVRWNCVCGTEIYQDVKIGEEAHIKELAVKMTETMRRNNLQEAPNTLGSIVGWFKKPSLNLPSHKSIAPSRQISSISTTPNPASQSSNQAAIGPNITLPPDAKYLLYCLNERPYRTVLLDTHIDDSTTTDYHIFNHLHNTYQRYFPHWRQRLSFKTLKRIDFVKFELLYDVGIDIKTRETPDCLPPPAPQVEYIYEIKGAPIGQRPMMHYFHNPECLRPIPGNYFVSRMPKRRGRLALDVLASSICETGWGLHFYEELDWGKVWLGLAVSFIASLLFGMLWSVYRNDIQGAFGVSSYVLTNVAIIIGLGNMQMFMEHGQRRN
ncbi:hypothetical protein ABW19_dt0200080 [Dactylella cylindrospora]|nr:hypothetical protein ABW19_dt0200080 [Dactylella cylindrospora]